MPRNGSLEESENMNSEEDRYFDSCQTRSCSLDDNFTHGIFGLHDGVGFVHFFQWKNVRNMCVHKFGG